ncbi:hypothetical protein CRYUN_Cryun38cG0010300 [Craigia yunnanensis]
MLTANEPSFTTEGFELSVGINHLGHFLLSQLLLDDLKQSDYPSKCSLEASEGMIIQMFGTPKEHRKSKPYHDHVFVFSVVDDHIWFRNYQAGPRFCLNPIKIFAGSFEGPTLYENPFSVSPNQKVGKYAKKVKAKTRRKMHELSNQLEPDKFADVGRE